jgi:two-component system, LytTR family, response regulator
MLTEMGKKLDPSVFKKISRSTVVNLNSVKEIQPWSHGDFLVILSNGVKLNASRKFRDNIFGERKDNSKNRSGERDGG